MKYKVIVKKPLHDYYKDEIFTIPLYRTRVVLFTRFWLLAKLVAILRNGVVVCSLTPPKLGHSEKNL